MWVTILKSVFELGALAVMMLVLAAVVSPIVDFAMSGPNADHETVGQVGTMFNLMTVDNLTLLAGLAVMLYLIWRATLEGRGG